MSYQTVNEFCKLILYVKDNPGLKQIELAQLLDLSTAKVSRLCHAGIQNKLITKNGRALYKGPAFENKIIGGVN